jgi:hypothetical protein
MTKRRLIGSIAAALFIVLGLYGCNWPANVLADLEDAEPISTFDGQWLGVEFAYAIEIVDRVGTVMQSHTLTYCEGDPILVIEEVDGNTFRGQHLFTDGIARNVIGNLSTRNTMTISGGGYIWTLDRFKLDFLPIARSQSVRVTANTPTLIILTGTNPDGPQDDLIFELLSLPINGVVTGTPPEVVYTPAPDFLGFDSFSFTVSDEADTSLPANVIINVVPPEEE